MNDVLDPILQQEAQRKLKVQLAWRLGIAATLIVLALFGINWLDRQKDLPLPARTPEPIAQPTAEPKPEKIALPTPVASAAVEASSALSISTPIASSSDSGVIAGATHKSPPTPSPAPSNKPTLKLEPVTPEPGSKPAPVIQTTPLPVKAPTPDAVPPATAEPAQHTATPQTAYPAAQHTRDGYTVQAGVFLQAQNANKLLSQLKAADIPAYTETRVQIGPFKDKASADAAAAKLKRLGIEPIVRGN
ncbi:SPOR domain-containing protein [Iodobacter fluviatilis]|uniref:DedD protein n=1 Tax=Iodobacter fluviatilis TaxID=537 RepID=A0A377Q7Y4_9NEIS|nr:SPOR domain-containing protein [Iodobacter fluviatilis]TCU89490.1 DedD protein [Iodobacter fluviatilis]STQ90860.1 Uncharacterized protein conserved in bacteria [Iodobacter fluviatilis]